MRVTNSLGQPEQITLYGVPWHICGWCQWHLSSAALFHSCASYLHYLSHSHCARIYALHRTAFAIQGQSKCALENVVSGHRFTWCLWQCKRMEKSPLPTRAMPVSFQSWPTWKESRSIAVLADKSPGLTESREKWFSSSRENECGDRGERPMTPDSPERFVARVGIDFGAEAILPRKINAFPTTRFRSVSA